MTLGDVTVVPHAASSLSINSKDLRMTLDHSPIFQFQDIEALPSGDGNFLDASQKMLRFRKVLTHELPHLACNALLQNFPRNLPYVDKLLIKVRNLDFIGHQDCVRGRFQHRTHGCKGTWQAFSRPRESDGCHGI